MGDVVVGHRKDGDLGDGSVPADDAPRPLVDGGQVGVHVTGVTAPARHLLPRRGHLAEGVGVGAHVRQNHEHVQVPLVREVFGRRQSQPRRDDALDGGVVREVEEEGRALHGARLLEVAPEEASRLHVHPHGPEHDREVVLVGVGGVLQLDEGGLPGDLGRHLVVGESRGREDGDLLPPRHGVHDVDGGNTRLDHGLGVIPRGGVDGLAVDVEVGLREDLRARVDDLPGPVERPTEHLLGHTHLEDVAGELAPGLAVVDVGGALEDLHDRAGSGDLEDLAGADGPVPEGEVDDLGVLRELDVVEDDQGTVDAGDCAIYLFSF